MTYQNIKVTDLTVGQQVTIEYLQPFNGSGSLRWKSGVVKSVGDKWIALDGNRGGWVPRNGVEFVRLWV